MGGGNESNRSSTTSAQASRLAATQNRLFLAAPQQRLTVARLESLSGPRAAAAGLSPATGQVRVTVDSAGPPDHRDCQ